ncbi:MAG: alpha/beta fold hydrolase [Terriglobales bacterium]
MGEFPENSSIVLVHGAWADGSCWRSVILPLERRGLHVICAPIPLTSLTDDANALSRALERTTGPVVLVGHAYSGAVIAAVREERVKSLVYIAALAPDEGETVAKVFYRDTKPPESPKLAPVFFLAASRPHLSVHCWRTLSPNRCDHRTQIKLEELWLARILSSRLKSRFQETRFSCVATELGRRF